MFGVCLGFAAVSGCAEPAPADDGDATPDQPEIRSVSVGFDGRFKVGCWTPIEVTLDGPPGATVTPRVIALDPDGSPTTTWLPFVTFSAGGPQSSRGLFRSGRLSAGIQVALGDAVVTLEPAAATAEPHSLALFPARQSVRFWGVVGEQPSIEQAARVHKDGSSAVAAAIEIIRFDTFDRIPTDPDALDALDVLVVASRFEIGAEQNAAVERWVRGGGQLLVALGLDIQAWQASPLSKWVPIEVTGTVRVPDLGALNNIVAARSTEVLHGGAEGARLRAEGAVVLSSGGADLLVRVACGFGRVTVLALDPDERPLKGWGGLPQLWLFMAGASVSTPAAQQEQHSVELAPTGVSDLATQLAAILDHFPRVDKPSNLTVLGFVLAFLLVAGPLDYLLVHRLFRRPHSTWATFPAWVLLAAAAGTLCAGSFNASGRAINRLDLLDLDASTGECRTLSWLTLYSAASRRYSVSARPAAWTNPSASDAEGPTRSLRVSWSGVPEETFRGMYRLGGLDLGNPPYELAEDLSGVENLPVDIWSSKALRAEWATNRSPRVESRLIEDGKGGLTGHFVHNLPDAISDWCLAYNRRIYFPGEAGATAILPGIEWEPARIAQVRLLDAYLTGVTSSEKVRKGMNTTDYVSNRSEYNPLDRNPLSLTRMLTFHEAAGGAKYTGLKNQTLGRSDLSPLLGLRRAVLFGRLSTPATEFTIDSEPARSDAQATFVRIVLPVAPAASGVGR